MDRATGLRADKMATCFLQVGQFTSTESSRGFFSRGAKDVSILGDVSFESIQDDYYSKCVITQDAYGAMVISDQPVTQDLRDLLKIPKNGMHITITVAPSYQCKNVQAFSNSIKYRATLRKILSDPANIVSLQYFDHNDTCVTDDIICYTYPEGNIILDLTYNVPVYNVPARWRVYQATKNIAQPLNENELSFGFLFTSYNTVHEASTLDSRFRWNPHMSMLFGTLECDYIIDLLLLL